MQPRSEIITIKDVKIRVQRAGSGAPLLFLHGAGGVPAWLPVLDKLSDQFDLIVPDHPGYGQSDTPPWLRGMNDMALYYLDFIEQLGFERIDVVATSIGGWIAAEAAVRDRSRIGAMTLIAPAGVRVKGISAADNFIWDTQEHAHGLYSSKAIAEAVLAAPVAPEMADIQLKNRFATARLGWEPRLFNPDLERWLPRLRLPVQVLWGEDDQLLPAAYAKAWEAQLPDATVQTIPAAGHLPHVEQADAVYSAIMSFHGRA